MILVQMKIDDAQKRFGELRSRVEDSLEQMEEALPLAQHFQEAHQGFLAWANKMETELRAVEHTLPESEETVEVSRGKPPTTPNCVPPHLGGTCSSPE